MLGNRPPQTPWKTGLESLCRSTVAGTPTLARSHQRSSPAHMSSPTQASLQGSRVAGRSYGHISTISNLGCEWCIRRQNEDGARSRFVSPPSQHDICPQVSTFICAQTSMSSRCIFSTAHHTNSDIKLPLHAPHWSASRTRTHRTPRSFASSRADRSPTPRRANAEPKCCRTTVRAASRYSARESLVGSAVCRRPGHRAY
ncbi:hypothetical protein C8Q73DRAFT_249070 [Cubamyces lactineus]|nr:hypothetical protein C8Q73DRAFT_249070 [Cubamyces lactineus]